MVKRSVKPAKARAPATDDVVHIMVDLETWSTKPDALIISIGAVQFDPHARKVGDRFHVGIYPDSWDAGAHIDPGTINWWMSKERDAARAEWNRLERVDAGTALEGFAQWLATFTKPVCIWGNGATFDNVVLRRAYQRQYIEAPWSYRLDRCYRTLKAQYPTIPMKSKLTAHNALSDAIMQAEYVQALVRRNNIAVR